MPPFPRLAPALFALAVLASLLLFYTAYDKATQTLVPGKLADVLFFKDSTKSLSEFNKVAALGAIGLIALTFLLGPLSRVFPRHFARYLSWRKFLGLSGFALALYHSLYSLHFIFKWDLDRMLYSNPNVLGIITGLLGLFIFALMALTSTKAAMQRLGYANWKALQTTGYLALFFVVLHFLILETKPEVGLDVRPFGLLFLALAVVALAARMLLVFFRLPPRTRYEEHVGGSGPEKAP